MCLQSPSVKPTASCDLLNCENQCRWLRGHGRVRYLGISNRWRIVRRSRAHGNSNWSRSLRCAGTSCSGSHWLCIAAAPVELNKQLSWPLMLRDEEGAFPPSGIRPPTKVSHVPMIGFRVSCCMRSSRVTERHPTADTRHRSIVRFVGAKQAVLFRVVLTLCCWAC